MRKILFILLLLFPLSMIAYEVDNGFKINSWTYEAHVQKNNVWEIKEIINVTFLEDRHGIYRYIPRKFVYGHNTNGDVAKYTYLSQIKDVDVKSYEFTTYGADDNQDNLVIRMGSEEETVIGNHTYAISYKVVVPDDRYSASDIIYTTILGTDTKTTIDKFQFTIHFDKKLPKNLASVLHIYSGEWGSMANELDIKTDINVSVVSGSAYNIAPYNGITLSAEVPNGYWEDAHAVSPISFYIWCTLALIAFCIVMVFFLSNKRETPLTVIEYSAPEGISSAEVGTIIDNSADLSDLTSLIVWFASKGYLEIMEIEGKKHLIGKNEFDIKLTKLKNLPPNSPKYQLQFWQMLFDKEDTVLLSKLGDRHEKIQAAMKSLSKHFTGDRTLTNVSMKSLLAITAFFIFGTMAIANSNLVTSFDEDLMFWAILLWAGPTLFVSIIRISLSNRDMITTRMKKMIQYIVIIVIGVFLSDIVCEHCYNQYDSICSKEILLSILAAGWLIALFSGRVMHDSKYRLEKMSLLLGFREFIDKSELPMLKAQVDENPSYFYDVLPYAMVFGLTDKWVKKFKEIDFEKPNWYKGTGTMSSYMMADHISHAVSSSMRKSIEVSSHDLTPSSSSGGGYSGGGFSGGGSGGGGCGSW